MFTKMFSREGRGGTSVRQSAPKGAANLGPTGHVDKIGRAHV